MKKAFLSILLSVLATFAFATGFTYSNEISNDKAFATELAIQQVDNENYYLITYTQNSMKFRYINGETYDIVLNDGTLLNLKPIKDDMNDSESHRGYAVYKLNKWQLNRIILVGVKGLRQKAYPFDMEKEINSEEFNTFITKSLNSRFKLIN